MSKTAVAVSTSRSLIALQPRQVLLSLLNMKQRNATETSKSSAVLQANQAPALEPEQRILLHHAVALYLERNGFSKTFKKFRSEAQLEKDYSQGLLLNLEEMCYKYLKKCDQADPTHNKQERMKEVADDRVPELLDEPTQKYKDKKRKKENAVSELLVDSVENERPQSLHVESLKISKDAEPAEIHTLCEESGKKSKDKKKKKNKEKSTGDDLESNRIAVAANSEDANVPRDSQAVDSTALRGNIAPHEEKVVKLKSKKKKNGQHLSDEFSKQLLTASINGAVNENGGIKTVSENDSYETSKKRKRLAVVENDIHPVNEKETEDMKRRKLEASKGYVDMQYTKVDASVETDVNAASPGTCNHHDEQTNANVEKTAEKTSSKKMTKKQANDSAEPKTVNAFQRVKIDDVVFTDDRLADNSYWAKGGAEIGYGAKAQEVLGQVKGRDFRHEKTKKKRGSYRGGVIDLQSHSVKFNYSDDD